MPGTCTNLSTKPGYAAFHQMFAPSKCLYGTYSDATSIGTPGGRTTTVDCSFVDQGKYSISASKGSADTANWKDCPTGYWCSGEDEVTGAIHKYPCPPGMKAKAGTNHGTITDACERCTAGKYCDGADHDETDCPAGYFCPAGTKFATQYPCPSGKKSAKAQISYSGCVACTAGEFCPKGTGINRECPPGSACNDK